MDKATETPGGILKRISLDTWAVALALFLALLVKLGIIQKVAW